jgi:hypothetical protein
VLGPAIRLGDGQVVLERRVRLLERIVELVALEDVVVATGSVVVSLVCVHRAADGPDRTGLPLDPDDDALLSTGIVDSLEHPLREPTAVGRSLHDADYTIDAVLRLGSLLRSPFSFLFAKSPAEENVAAYVLREHGNGRRIEDILEDPYVQNRLSVEQQRRLLSRPDVIHALGEQAIEAARAALSEQ